MRRETTLKIIGLLRKELNRGLTILAISKRLDIGYRPAYNHITELQKQGAIITHTVGKARQCLLNLENEMCRYFLQENDFKRKEALFKQQIKLRNVLENYIARLTARFVSDIHSIILFGSYAKGTATKTSDIDVFFILSDIKNKPLRDAIEQEAASYQNSHNLKLSPLISDIHEFKKMLKSKELNVGKELREYGIPLYGAEQFWRFIAWQEETP